MKRTGQALGSEYSTQQGANRRKIEGNHPAWFHALIPFRTAVPIRGQTCLIPSDLSPKRDWGPKRVKGPLCIPYSWDFLVSSSEAY